VTAIRVLIADDEPGLLSALTDLLSSEEGLEVVGAAGDADQAIEAAISGRPHVALVDVKMPGGGGARAAREIIRRSPQTRVIALSAFEDRPTVLEMLKAGAVGYLVKGAGAEEIVNSISAVAQGGTSLSAGVMERVVQELSTQLRREEAETAGRRTREERIRRFLQGEGTSMAFQPIVDLRTREPVGFEALSRFDVVPHRSPDQWFREAREFDLDIELELVAIGNAFAAFGAIPDETYLSVNASHRTASHPVMTEALSSAVPGRIVVEITEHEPVEDYGELRSALDRLRGMGVRIAIDDAGAGFASLYHTLQLEPDIVKLDIALTRDIDSDRARRALARSLISFADEMEMTIVAEGIQTRSELDTLLELGVKTGQGFYLAKPKHLI
jgi:EAL domain-containing protein (putative c-di-GMP-specific phosphodiesterase class I)/CheY-like chemotaxis protein